MITIAKLRSFEDERFYSVLDVALDIRGELDFHVDSIEIPLIRSVVRYEALMPGDGINMRDRYCELRWKASEFLEAEGYLRHVDYIHTYGLHRWENRIQVEVVDSEQFYQLVVMLTEEEERRAPGSAAEDLPSTMSRVDQLGDRFHRAALKLRSSRIDSSVFAINNEYDVQTLMHALLATRFDDIRPEEWTPSYAGKSSRTDFLLKQELVLVETKMMRDGLNDARLADELIIDTDRYKKHPDCKAVFCFVYDPEHRLKNPSGLEADLSRRTDGLLVRVQIRPRT
jgi:hypothetical protein